MKLNLLKALILALLFTSTQSFSQVTLLSNNNSPAFGFALNSKGLFITRTDSLWVTDGTAPGTAKLTNVVSYVDSAGGVLYKNKYYFAGTTAANGIELWATDGTAAGTTLIKDINTGASNSVPSHFIVYNNTLFFTANDGTNGKELWSCDGTAAGTALFKDINPGAASAFTSGTVNYALGNGFFYLTATDATNGRELWRSDGTAAGTTLVKNITTGTASTNFGQFITYGTSVIFSVTTGAFPFGNMQLWKSDGTSAGTTLIKDFGAGSGLFPPSFYAFNNKIYFTGTDATNGSELWVTDGTVAGTTLVKDINPGSDGSFPFLSLSVVINNKLYFPATTENEGQEIWVTDGTPGGTQLFMDINAGPGDGATYFFTPFDFSNGYVTNTLYNGKAFFMGNSGSTGDELWMTDGTVGGTTMVKEIKSGTGGGLDSSGSYFYTTSGMYFSATNGVTGVEPWLTNGTSGGTNMVFDINNGPAPSDPNYMFIVNNQLFFNASNGDSPTETDLYKINGAVSALLPINLLNFSATVATKNAVKLDWITTNEINSSHFEIERSIDGTHFSNIANVNSSGNSTINQNYSYTDFQAGTLNAGVLYYRLKMVDKDGTSKSSQVLLVRLQRSGFQFTFAPNPVQQQLNVTVTPAGAKSIALRILDGSGKQVYQKSLSTDASVYQHNIDVSKLKTGIYYLQIITDNTVKVEKFVKQ